MGKKKVYITASRSDITVTLVDLKHDVGRVHEGVWLTLKVMEAVGLVKQRHQPKLC